MKKSLLTLFVITLPTYCFSYPQNFYVGTGLGADSVNFHQNSHITRPGTFDVIERDQLAAQGIFGTLFGGYGFHHNCFYLGGEVNGNASSADFQTSNNNITVQSKSTTTYKINYSWGLSVLPGFLIPGDALVYGRIGYSSGHLVVKTTDISLADANKMLAGLRVGAGFEKNLCKNFGLRFDYSHISYQNHFKKVFDPVGTVTKKTTFNPDSNLVEFSVVYRFV